VWQQLAQPLLGQLLDVVARRLAAQDHALGAHLDGEVADPPARAGGNVTLQIGQELWRRRGEHDWIDLGSLGRNRSEVGKQKPLRGESSIKYATRMWWRCETLGNSEDFAIIRVWQERHNTRRRQTRHPRRILWPTPSPPLRGRGESRIRGYFFTSRFFS